MLNSCDAARIAIDQKLYVPSWSLIDYLEDISMDKFEDICIIHIEDGLPVGVGILSNNTVMFYIKPDHRRKGIGTKLFKRLLKTPDISHSDVLGYAHDFISYKFFESLKIEYMDLQRI